MLDLVVNSRIARDLSARQFAAGARRSARADRGRDGRAPRSRAPRAPCAPCARLADRLEPAQRCAPQS